MASTRLIECGGVHFTTLEPFLEEKGKAHVNIFCLETRLKRVSFACGTLRVNAFERVPSETNEEFRRNLF